MAFAPSRADAILVVFCFPFLDLRYLLADGPFGEPRWQWLASEEHKPISFVGELGRVLRPVTDDGRPGAIDMRAAVRFPGQPLWQSVVGRHILADKSGQVQAQIGFLADPQGDLPHLLERIGNVQVEVPRGPGNQASLTAAGLALAERYLANTALTSKPPAAPPFPHLVREGAGSPFLVLAGTPGEVEPPAEAWPFTGHPRLTGPAHAWTGPVGDQELDIWLLGMRRKPAGTRMTVIRSLCRIIGWLQELAILERVVADPGGLTPDAARIEHFVNDRRGKLRRTAFDGWPVEPILARVNRQSAALDGARARFGTTVAPILSREAGNDILATLGRIDLHRDALRLEAGTGLDPEHFVQAVQAIVARASTAPQRDQGEMPQVVERLAARAEAVPGALLPGQEIRALQVTLVQAGLAADRDALLAGLDPGLVAGLQKNARPDAQLLLDLMALNRMPPAQGVAPPLAEVLRNAAALLQGRDSDKAAAIEAVAVRVEAPGVAV